MALAGLVLLAVLTQQWGVPWAAQALVAPMPRSVDQSLEAAVIDSLGPPTLGPTRLPPARQADITAAWEAAKDRLDQSLARQGEAPSPALSLRFHASRLGPNALALPGGTVVITDELVALAGTDMPLLLGVLGHEQGHVQHRHGLRMAAQVGLLSVLVGSLWGDPGSLVSALPLWWGQADYSRDAEREADAWSLRLLQANDLDPRAMVRLFQALAAGRTCATPPADCPPAEATGADVLQTLGFASHPAPAERLRFFEQAAGRP
jgi:Zn-dependent protease with chaperone function